MLLLSYHRSRSNECHFFSRIPIHERVELPESWIPADSRVEIDAKITAGKTLSANPTHLFGLAFCVCVARLGVLADLCLSLSLSLCRLLHGGQEDDGRGTERRPGPDVGRVSTRPIFEQRRLDS